MFHSSTKEVIKTPRLLQTSNSSESEDIILVYLLDHELYFKNFRKVENHHKTNQQMLPQFLKRNGIDIAVEFELDK